MEAGEVELKLEPLGSHLLHGLELVEDVLEGREVVFHPGVAHGRIIPDGVRPSPGGGWRPSRSRRAPSGGSAGRIACRTGTPAALPIRSYHGLGHGDGGLVPDPVEGTGADVFLQHFLGFVAALPQSVETLVGMNHVDGSTGGAVEVIQFVVEPVEIVQLDVVGLDVGDDDGSVDRIRGAPGPPGPPDWGSTPRQPQPVRRCRRPKIPAG